MSRRAMVALVLLLMASMLAFAFGLVWLMRTAEDAHVLAHAYRDLQSMPGLEARNPEMVASTRSLIATLEGKRIPYPWPFTIGFALLGVSTLLVIRALWRGMSTSTKQGD